MNLTEYLIEKGTLDSLPHDIVCIVADNIYSKFTSVLDTWHENFSGWYTFSSPYDAYVSFREILIKNPPELGFVMKRWWNRVATSDVCKGAVLCKDITDFYREYRSHTPLAHIPNFDRDSFSSLFDGKYLPSIIPEFKDFFNKDNGTYVKYENLSRTKYLPYTLSKNRIIKKFDKNAYFAEMHLCHTVEKLLEKCDFGGNSWDEYITKLVTDKIQSKCPIQIQAYKL